MLPSKDSATWRATVTTLQAFAGFLIAVAAQPETMGLITRYYPWIVPTITIGAGLASLLLNLMRKDVENW